MTVVEVLSLSCEPHNMYDHTYRKIAKGHRKIAIRVNRISKVSQSYIY